MVASAWVFVCACYGSSGTSSAPETDAATSTVFAGRWLVHQPTHATYEATLYHFRRDGELVERGSVGERVPTGHVERSCGGAAPCSGETVRCYFGERWWSTDPETIVIRGDCSDGDRRPIALSFENLEDAGERVPRTIVVDGEPGWEHKGFSWQWLRCETDDCLPEP